MSSAKCLSAVPSLSMIGTAARTYKVLMVHNEYAQLSGEEIVVRGQCQVLEEHGHQVLPFFRKSAEIGGLCGKVRAFFSGIYSPKARTDMRRVLAEQQPDIVHVHNVFPLISPSVLTECRRAGVPVVMTVHNYRLTCPNGLHLTRGKVCEKCLGGREYWCVLKNCEASVFKSLGYALRNYMARKGRLFLDNVTMYAALTEFQRGRLIAAGFPADRIMVIPNMAKPCAMDHAPVLGDYVGFVGRVSPEKGLAALITAARNHADIPFMVAGNYARMPELVQQAPENFRFRDQLGADELAAFYRQARIIVLCSVCFEGFPTVLAEAMLRGKAVICSRIGGLPEIVDDGQTGLLFEPGNEVELAAKIRCLWDQPELCLRLGQAGRTKALREYGPEKYYERLMALYEKASTLAINT